MTERQELTKEINDFYKNRDVPNGIRYKQGHTIICSEHFIQTNLRTINSDALDRFWRLALIHLNELRMALVDKTFELVEIKDPVAYQAPPETEVVKIKPIEKTEPVRRSPLVVDVPQRKTREPVKSQRVSPQTPTLF